MVFIILLLTYTLIISYIIACPITPLISANIWNALGVKVRSGLLCIDIHFSNNLSSPSLTCHVASSAKFYGLKLCASLGQSLSLFHFQKVDCYVC